MEGLRKPWASKQGFPVVVISSGIKPFLAPGLDSVFYCSSAKALVVFGTVPDHGLVSLYPETEFVAVKEGDPVPRLSVWSWWLKLEAGSEIVFKEGEGRG